MDWLRVNELELELVESWTLRSNLASIFARVRVAISISADTEHCAAALLPGSPLYSTCHRHLCYPKP